MADKPIIFSAPMVRALLDGRKTQTRRVISQARVFATPEQPSFTLRGKDMQRALQNASDWRHIVGSGDGWFWESDAFPWQAPNTRTGWMAHVGFAVGDRLWVRENFRGAKGYDAMPPAKWGNKAIWYVADGEPDAKLWWQLSDRSRPSIHMPRWASRITLTVTEVRVQRLQDVSEEDAKAEGIAPLPSGRYFCGHDDEGEITAKSPATAFAWLWNSIHGPGAWDANPWIAAITFTVEKRNIDQ